MKFESIESLFIWMQDGYSFSEPLLDAINSHREGGKQALEELFDKVLWLSPDHEFKDDAEQQYYIGLSRIEEILVRNSLVYND